MAVTGPGPCRNCGVPARQVTVLPGHTAWRHDVTDPAGIRHVYRWCRLYEAEPGTPNR